MLPRRDLGLRITRLNITRPILTTLTATIIALSVLGVPTGATLFRSAEAFDQPYNIGDVFAGVGNGLIEHRSPTGTLIETLDTTTGSEEVIGMCFDGLGNLYSADFQAGVVSKFNNMGGLIAAEWATGFVHPESCVRDAAGNIYVGEVDRFGELGNPDSKLYKFTPDGTLLATFSPDLENRGVDWIDLAADQCTMYYTSEGELVKRFDVCTDTQLTDFASGLTDPLACFALRILSDGGVMVACSDEVKRLDSSGTVVQTYPRSGFTTIDPSGEPSFLFAMNLDPDGTSFWTAGYFTGNIYKVDIATGAVLESFTAPPAGFATSGLAVFGEITAAVPNDLQIKKFVSLFQEGFSVDESINSLFTQVKLVEATLVEPDRVTIHVYHDIPKDIPTIVLFSDSNWSPGVQLVNGKWELKLQIIATYEDGKTGELKNIEQKIIIQFDVVNREISMPTGSNTIDLSKEILISPHPAQLNGDMKIEIGEDITGETKVFVAEVTLGKPSGEIVSYTTLPIDITAGSVTIPFPGAGWVSSDGSAELDQVGMWQLDIEIIGFYEDGTLAIKKVNQKLWISFNVIPEYPLAILAIATPLAVFFLYSHKRRQRSQHNLDGYGL